MGKVFVVMSRTCLRHCLEAARGSCDSMDDMIVVVKAETMLRQL